jgi:hypothetical protein
MQTHVTSQCISFILSSDSEPSLTANLTLLAMLSGRILQRVVQTLASAGMMSRGDTSGEDGT